MTLVIMDAKLAGDIYLFLTDLALEGDTMLAFDAKGLRARMEVESDVTYVMEDESADEAMDEDLAMELPEDLAELDADDRFTEID
jgi:hypothetical protein